MLEIFCPLPFGQATYVLFNGEPLPYCKGIVALFYSNDLLLERKVVHIDKMINPSVSENVNLHISHCVNFRLVWLQFLLSYHVVTGNLLGTLHASYEHSSSFSYNTEFHCNIAKENSNT